MPFSPENAMGNCPFCETKQLLITHIPKCYREFGHYFEMKPLCTCDNCQGWHSHDGMDNKRRKKNEDNTEESNQYFLYSNSCNNDYFTSQSRSEKVAPNTTEASLYYFQLIFENFRILNQLP